MTREALAQNCAIYSARSVSDSAYEWGCNRLKSEYNQYLNHLPLLDEKLPTTVEELSKLDVDILSYDEYTLLYLLNKYVEYYSYIVECLKIVEDKDLSTKVAMQLISNLYIERFGIILAQFCVALNSDFNTQEFIESERLDKIAAASMDEDTIGMMLTSDVLPGKSLTIGSMLKVHPTVTAADEYRRIYKIMALLAAVALNA